MKKAKKLLALIFSLIFALSAFSATANAANLLLQHPTTENPMTFSYNVKETVYDKYGRAQKNKWWYTYHMDFYPSKAAYEAKEDPIETIEFGTDENGQEIVSYKDVFVKDPPASLYFHVQPVADTIFSPASGYVMPQ